MRDKILEAMRQRDCILGVVPDHGGMWLSPLRPNAPRNFAVQSYAWNDAQTAISGADQSHDFTFTIDFRNEKNNASYVFASDGLRDFIRVFMSNGTVIVNTALLGTSSGGSTQFSAGSDSIHRHVLTVKFAGNSITALVDGEIIYTRENMFRNVIEIGTPRSNSGYVYKISLTDDTTGETVWEAARTDLYETNNPWPSDNPDTTPGISEAERVRLLTKTNVRTDRGVFEAADVSKLYYVDTQLDLRGYAGDVTMVAHINIEAEAAPSSAKQYHILSQGGPNTPYRQTVYSMYITRYPDNTLGFKFLISDGTRWLEVEKSYSELTLDRIHTVGVVLIKETREQRWFVNGSYIGSVTVPAAWTYFNNTATAIKNTRLGPHVFNANYWPPNLPKYEAAYCFLRALSAAEIAALAPKQA